MATQAPLTNEMLESICQVIADTQYGLTGTEIGRLLQIAKIPDVDSTNTKWKRLFNACAEWQNKNRCSNNIFDFIMQAMSPVRYMSNQDIFEWRRENLNKRLIFIGLKILEKGTIGKIDKVETIKDAERKASQLKAKLLAREVHDDVIKFCRAELLADNYFHAVFETTKSIATKLRTLSGSTADGNELIDMIFSVNNPVVIINGFVTDTEKSEHKGFANMLRGLFGMFRNTLAHAPKIEWEMSERDALDIMSIASLCHRRLDVAQRIRML